MFLGAMIMGPLGGYTMKRLDALWDGKIKPGFEMLVNNFSAGIWGMILAIFGFFDRRPVRRGVHRTWPGNVVDFLVDHSLLPLTSIFIEPAKVLFLNNAINHGVLTPLGTQQAAENGKSILFLLEANPGPGCGLLLAFTFFGKGLAKATAPGAAIIQFFGGIHEIYFPYVLMKPKLILAMILGGMTGVAINVVFDSGLRAPAAPGSIIAVWLQAPARSLVGRHAVGALRGRGVLHGRLDPAEARQGDDEDDLAAATAQMEANKGKKSSVAGALVGAGAGAASTEIRSIVFACDAGMGSSAMGASVLRKKIQAAGHGEVTVVNKAISEPDRHLRPGRHPPGPDRPGPAEDAVGDPRLGRQLHGQPALRRDRRADRTSLRTARGRSPWPSPRSASRGRQCWLASSIVLGGTAKDRDAAIEEAGRLLVDAGAVDPSYVASMHEREKSVSTYMGNGLAIPHGTNEAKGAIRRTAISFVRYDRAHRLERQAGRVRDRHRRCG